MKISWKGWTGLAGVVVLIALVAIPQYAGYAHRAQASEAVSIMGAARTPLAEYFAEHKKWPVSLDKVNVNRQGRYTQSVVISRGAGGTAELELTATMKTEGVDSRVGGQSVRLGSKDGGQSWVCSPGTMEVKHLPATCRN
jgi:type IV pilus assembly protein PilA